MKRRNLLLALFATACTTMYAGGLMTNTNYHIAFDRMFARGATTEIDAAYSNPAGLAWGHEGWQLSLNFQKPWQYRDITTTSESPLFQAQYGESTHKFKGKASAPIIPALFASYKKDRWALSTMIGIVGSGGFVEYKEGIPMFNVMSMGKIYQQTGGMITPNMYTIDSNVKGKQYIYGGQLNFTYRIIDCLSAAVGLRANYYDGYNRGHVNAVPRQDINMVLPQLLNLNLDVIQRGWGYTPIIGIDYHKGPLTIGAKYEFRTKITTKNDTRALNITMAGQKTDIKAMAEQYGNETTLAGIAAAMGPEMAEKIKDYMPDAKTRYDMPALLALAVQYEFTTKLRGAVEYHFFDDKHAKMANARQKELSHGTHEILAGVEYDINKMFTISMGGQRTDYGLSKGYQSNTSFACDSYSVGLGGAININEKLRVNVSYFCSLYSDYTVESDSYLGTGAKGKDVYSRTNHVIGIGVDYKF